MRHISIRFEDCFRADEIERMKTVIAKDRIRAYHRDRLLEDLDRSLPDYERPLKAMSREKKPWSFIRFVKSILP